MITAIGQNFLKGFFDKYASINEIFSITHDVSKLEFERTSVAENQ